MIKDQSGHPYCVFFVDKPLERKEQLLLEISAINGRLRFTKLPVTSIEILREQCAQKTRQIKEIEKEEKNKRPTPLGYRK